ncbi:MAG TPA: proton-conducting transporter membrane subunit, partial [Burkholderiaceae bacterium]|nr:proton-conducting transporter membrane subunit [Burkholderiaceae bacterium]
KLGFPLFPDATLEFTPLVMVLAVASIVIGAGLALVQDDIKKIIAYSSISHLGYVMLGLVSLDLLGIQGAIIQMVSHGLTAAGLFLMIGMIYERCHTRDLAAYGGLARALPVYSVAFMVLTLASIGLPTTSGFTGEFLVLLGSFNAAWAQHLKGADFALWPAVIAISGVVLGALYMLRFAARFLFGEVRLPGSDHGAIADLVPREKAILVALIAAVFWLGLFPGDALRKTEPAARAYQQLVQKSRLPAAATAEAPRSTTP